jgi:DNA replication and repair protein RecF
MWLRKLKIINFKNHAAKEYELNKGWVCITGLNGVGKTNILDAIWFISNCRSYFGTTDQHLILTNEIGFSIKTWVVGKQEMEVLCRLEKGKRKNFVVNESPIKKLSEHLGTIHLVFITPSDISLVLDHSDERRKFVDLALSKVYPDYLSHLEKYKKALESRNSQLKQFAKNNFVDLILLEPYSNILVHTASPIYTYRKQFIEELNKDFAYFYSRLTQENEIASINYASHLNDKNMQELLFQNIEKDLILERTLKGIHADDLIFELNGFPLKKFASQGQIKSFVIAIKLALFVWTRNKTSQIPILLLDDIYEKIDGQRAEILMQIISELKIEQVFVTDTHKERVETNLKNLQDHTFFIDL